MKLIGHEIDKYLIDCAVSRQLELATTKFTKLTKYKVRQILPVVTQKRDKTLQKCISIWCVNLALKRTEREK